MTFRDAAEFENWLDAHVDLRVGVWLKIAKKGSGVPSLTDKEAVDAQAFGALGRTQRYAVILKLATARTETARAAQVRRAVSALEEEAPNSGSPPHPV